MLEEDCSIEEAERQQPSQPRNKVVRKAHLMKLTSISYSHEMKRVMVLDNITEHIILYDEHSQVQKRLYTNKENHILDTAILYFAYSKSEKRVN